MTGGTEAGLPPDLKDAMVAIVGGGIALGGLLLIFVGFLFAQAAALEYASPPAPKAITARYRMAARMGLIPFAVSLLVAVAAIAYWFTPCALFAKLVIVAFGVCAVGSVAYGIDAARRL